MHNLYYIECHSGNGIVNNINFGQINREYISEVICWATNFFNGDIQYWYSNSHHDRIDANNPPVIQISKHSEIEIRITSSYKEYHCDYRIIGPFESMAMALQNIIKDEKAKTWLTRPLPKYIKLWQTTENENIKKDLDRL